jgi:ABC-2 type transport system ATP-binding protein
MNEVPTAVSPLVVMDVGVRFRHGWALRHCSFQLRRGTVTAVVGPNGAGKTTLLSAVAGLRAPTEGRIEIDGRAVTTTPAHAELGFLAQDKPLYRSFRVRDMLEAGRRMNARWDAAHAGQLVRAARLDPGAKVGLLSEGERTRLALALVLGRRPSLLVLDEPMADLDPLARLEIAQTLMTEVADTGMTVLLSSHILGEVQDMCDDLLLLQEGRIAVQGVLEELLATHRVLIGPAATLADRAFLPRDAIVEVSQAARQTTVLLNRPLTATPEGWAQETPSLDEVVVGYLRAEAERRTPAPGRDASR